MKIFILYRINFLICSILIILTSCSKEDQKKFGASVTDTFKFNKEFITIGTFNLEWFGDGINDRIDRTDDDLRNYAKIIKDLDVDILGVQEIENDVALNKLVNNYLKGYSYYIGKEGGNQKIAVLYKKGLNVKYLGEYYPLMVVNRRTKPGLLVNIKAGNFDFNLMVVHLKSSSHWDNTPEKMANSFGTRESQAQVLATWCDSVVSDKNEQDIIVVGDFNDTPRRTKNNSLYPLDNYHFLTENLRSCRFKNAYTIDHILVSSSASDRFIKNSEFMYDVSSTFSKEESKGLSDHCPVISNFDIKKADNDPPKKIAKK
jgi:endonuclease/exonuclease/phosphatase family metal-dependent hydrolase